MKKVAIIIDGRNFYVGWRRSAPAFTIDFPVLIDWLIQQAGGDERAGVHFLTMDARLTTSYDDSTRVRLQHMCESLRKAGAEIVMLPSRTKEITCKNCGHAMHSIVEKQGEAEMTVRAIGEADRGADVVVLCTGDVDVLPIVRELQDQWDTRVVVASWQESPIAGGLRAVADHVVLLKASDPFMKTTQTPSDEDVFVEEVGRAVDQFNGGYVGLHYFLTKWRSDNLTPITEQRSLLLNKLVDEKRVEIYDAEDGKKAIKLPGSTPVPAAPQQATT